MGTAARDALVSRAAVPLFFRPLERGAVHARGGLLRDLRDLRDLRRGSTPRQIVSSCSVAQTSLPGRQGFLTPLGMTMFFALAARLSPFPVPQEGAGSVHHH